MANDKSHPLYHYDPSLAAAVVFLGLFIKITLLHTYQLFRTRTWYFICFVIGGYLEAIGFLGRIINSDQSPDWKLGPFILQAVLLLVAPSLFAASIYMALGRIIQMTKGEHLSIIRRTWLTKIFVVGDILSFFVQSAGASLLTKKDTKSIDNGRKIVIVGLAIQILFFGFFIIASYIFHLRMRKTPTSRVQSDANLPWEKHLFVLYSVSLLILIRSIFRFIEYAQGRDGYLMSHEAFLYVFDASLMFVTMIIMAWYHPSEINALLPKEGSKDIKDGVYIYKLVITAKAASINNNVIE